MSVNNDIRVLQQNLPSGGVEVNPNLEVEETEGLFEVDGVLVAADTEEAQQLKAKKNFISLKEGGEIFTLMLEAGKQYGHFAAAMPQEGQGSPEVLEKMQPVWDAGNKIITKFYDNTSKCRDEYERALKDPNISEGQLRAIATRTKDTIEKESKKAEAQLEKLTLVAQACMEVAVYESRSPGSVDISEVTKNLNETATEIEKKPVTDKELNDKDNNKKSDALTASMEKKIEKVNQKILAKQEELKKPGVSEFQKRQIENSMWALESIRDMYVNIAEGADPTWKTRDFNQLG